VAKVVSAARSQRMVKNTATTTTDTTATAIKSCDALPLWLSQQLNRSIAKHLEKG